jgi:hypothetical protein
MGTTVGAALSGRQSRFIMAKKKPKPATFRCKCGEIGMLYWLKDEVWAKLEPHQSSSGHLCPRCAGKWLRRKLTLHDLAIANYRRTKLVDVGLMRQFVRATVIEACTVAGVPAPPHWAKPDVKALPPGAQVGAELAKHTEDASLILLTIIREVDQYFPGPKIHKGELRFPAYAVTTAPSPNVIPYLAPGSQADDKLLMLFGSDKSAKVVISKVARKGYGILVIPTIVALREKLEEFRGLAIGMVFAGCEFDGLEVRSAIALPFQEFCKLVDSHIDSSP